jgi:LPS export ABC transporter protein LptC
VCASGCTSPPTPGVAEAAEDSTELALPSTPPVTYMEDVRFSYSERGEIVHVLLARYITRTEGASATVDASGGITLFVDGDEKHHGAKMTARQGKLTEATFEVEAEYDVVVVNAAGDRLETEYITWSAESDLIRTDRPVVIHTAEGVIRGTGLESDSRFERYRILKPTGELDVVAEF